MKNWIKTKNLIATEVWGDDILYLPQIQKSFLGFSRTYYIQKKGAVFGDFPYVYFFTKEKCLKFFK